MKKELEGRLSRLEGRVGEAAFTDDQWRLMELIADGHPIPPELRAVKLPLAMIRSLFDDDDDGVDFDDGGEDDHFDTEDDE